MSTTTELTQTYHVTEAGASGTGGRTVTYWAALIEVEGATQRESRTLVVSAGVSAQELTLGPFNAANPAALLVLTSDQQVDVRLNAATASAISAVRYLAVAAQISALFLTTISNVAAPHIALDAVGGSAATVCVTSPHG